MLCGANNNYLPGEGASCCVVLIIITYQVRGRHVVWS